jgi:hypothetical protein
MTMGSGLLMMNVTEKADSLAGDLAELRHALHQEPEVGPDLPGTPSWRCAARGRRHRRSQ